MGAGTAATGPATSDEGARRTWAVDTLIAKFKPGRSVRAIERDARLAEGALGHYLKPPQRGSIPRRKVIQRFADALGADFDAVAEAFILDSSYISVRTGSLTAEETEYLALYRALPQTLRSSALRLLRALVDDRVPEIIISGTSERTNGIAPADSAPASYRGGRSLIGSGRDRDTDDGD